MTDGAPGFHSMSPDRAPMSPPPDQPTDWQVNAALASMRDEGDRPWVHEEGTEALAALARLREREARRERQYADEKEGDSLIAQTWKNRAEAAEARVAKLGRERDNANLAIGVLRAEVAKLEEALLSIKVSPPNNAQTLIEIARRALAHEEEKPAKEPEHHEKPPRVYESDVSYRPLRWRAHEEEKT